MKVSFFVTRLGPSDVVSVCYVLFCIELWVCSTMGDLWISDSTVKNAGILKLPPFCTMKNLFSTRRNLYLCRPGQHGTHIRMNVLPIPTKLGKDLIFENMEVGQEK